MTAGLRRTVTVLVAALGVAFLLVWAASTGPGELIGQPRDASVVEPVPDTPSPGPGKHPDTDGVEPASQGADALGSLTGWVQDVTAFLVVVAGLLVVGRILGHVFVRLREDLEELVLPLDPLPDLDKARAAIEREEDKQREALAGSDVRNGIVECWVLFEQAAAQADLGRRPAETATEFVVRFLHLLDVDPRPVAALERLFHEARFSTHPMPADARARAVDALARIHQELAQTGVST